MDQTEDLNALIDIPEGEKEDFFSDDDLFKISSWGADLSFRELIARYDENELVKPELQRYYVWDKTEASRFIDSILLGLPVPSIFLAKTTDEKLLIIDGYQRLMTVRDYVKGIFSKDEKPFRLSRSEKVHERWRGKAFSELDDEEQRKIRNTTIHAIIFMQRHPVAGDTSLYQVFERINSSGRTLLPQEIRNCVYQGPMNSLLFELNENKLWRDLYGNDSVDERMRDLELILRFFALSSFKIMRDKTPPSKISLKKFLSQFMDESNEESLLDDFRYRFSSSIEFAHKHIGLGAFHNISPSDKNKLVEKFSPTVFDSVLIAIDNALNVKRISPNVDNLEQKRRSLLQDEGYQSLLSLETMKVNNIRSRVAQMHFSLFGESYE